jgi:hypothetical protein
MGQPKRMQVMKHLKVILLATSMMMGVASNAAAEENIPLAGKQSVIPKLKSTIVEPGPVPEELPMAEEHYAKELVTDNYEFMARGFMDFDWQTHTNYVQKVLSDVVIPDYVRRTGKQRPLNPSIDVAAAMITNPYFNDLIVQSRLPGDCVPEGCLVQIYSLVGEMWVKKFQTTTFAMMAKPGDKLGTVLLGLVGNSEIPSRTVLWTGTVFKEI